VNFGSLVFYSFIQANVRCIRYIASNSPPSRLHEEHPEVSITWHNVESTSDFVYLRRFCPNSIEQILVDFGRVVESGIFENVLSVNANESWFCVAVACSENYNEGVNDAIFSVG
jgi:hypothetical protein